MPEFYTLPPVGEGERVHNLVPDTGAGNVLTPESIVEMYNRAPHALRDTYDGRHYTIPPGRSYIQYGAANHFRERSTIPGSRNPETGKQSRYLLIPFLRDPVALCVPFLEGDFAVQQARPEAIDRASLTSAAARNVVLRSVSQELARAGGSFEDRTPNVGLEGNNPKGQDVPEDALDANDNAGQREQAADAAAAAADGYTVDPTDAPPVTRRRVR